MKKNWLISLLALGCAATLSFAFAGCGAQGEKGEKGEQGVGIEKVEYDKDGNLVITLTDGSKQTVAMPEKEEGGADSTQEGTPGLHYQRIAGKDEYRVIGLGIAAETDIVIPATYNGMPITEIADYAFDREKCITSITLPDSVTSIGYDAFNCCDSLTGVYITDIAAWCNISFESNPLYCAKNLYLNNELVTKLVIPDSVTSIGEGAFENCDSLREVVIPDSVTSIGYEAFYNCSSLTIYCEAESKPSGWNWTWNYSNRPVVWGYKGQA